MADIFISYSREDETRIKKLVPVLEGHGWSVFWDRRIPAGETWRSYIGTALDEARCILVAWSEHSIGSSWVAEEAEDAKKRGILFPILLDPVEPPRGFREIQAADLTDWKPGKSSQRFDELIEDIRRRLQNAPKGLPDSVPESSSAAQEMDKYRTLNINQKRLIFKIAVVVAVFVVIAALLGYLSLKQQGTEPLVEGPTLGQGAPPESKPKETQVETRTEPTSAATKDTAAKRVYPEPPPPFALRAVIDDPDGYTNVRSMKSASSDIVTRVYKDEVFYTHIQDGNWWQIKTKDGKIGYMHVSRIRIFK